MKQNKTNITLLGLMVITLFSLPTHSVSADEIFSQSECVDTGQGGNSEFDSIIGNTKRVNVYVQSDIGDRIVNCLNQDANINPDGQIFQLPAVTRNSSVHNVVAAASEVWNMESRSSVLKYRGPINANDIEAVCSSLEKPAVLVRFHGGCRNDSGACEASVAYAGNAFAPNCNNATEIIIWGDGNTNGQCSALDGNFQQENTVQADTFTIDSTTDKELLPGGAIAFKNFDLIGLITHELGHILNLQDAPSAVDSDESVMHSGIAFNAAMGRHLFSYDKDCVDDTGLVDDNGNAVKRMYRSLSTKYIGFNSSGSQVGYVNSFTNASTKKSNRGGGSSLHQNIDTYMIYQDNAIAEESAYKNGSFNFIKKGFFPTWFSSPSHDMIKLYDQPLLTSLRELSGYSMFYNYVFHSSYPLDEPPSIRNISDNNNDYLRNSYADKSTLHCLDINCNLSNQIRSHLPIVSAWDHLSSNTVFASVNTSRMGGIQSEPFLGNIYIYPGIESSSTYTIKLNKRSDLRDNQTPPSDPYSGFNFQLQTDSAPGISCAGDYPWYGNAYNCLLAWVDHGIMERRILYTFFRINSSNQVEWKPGSPNVWGLGFGQNVASVSHISVAHFNDRFWVAWKSLSNDVCYVKTDPLSPTWGSVQCLNRTKVVDPPTWNYVPSDMVPSQANNNHESALTWTEHN